MEKSVSPAAERSAAPTHAEDQAVICQSLKGTILSWSAGAERLFGYSEEEAVGKSIGLLIPAAEQMQETLLLHRLTSGAHISRHRATWLAKENREVEIFLTVSLLYDDLGRVAGVTQMVQPVMKGEGALRDDPGMCFIDQARLAQLRHDVRSPLNAVLGIANLLPAAGPFTQQQQKMVETLKTSSADLHEKIENLFGFLHSASPGAAGGAERGERPRA